MDPDLLFAKIIPGRARHEPVRRHDCVQQAVGAMMAGPNSPDLRILAGLRRPYFRPDVESRLERAVSELRIQRPSLVESALQHAILWTEEILANVNDRGSLVQQVVQVHDCVHSLDADQGDLITHNCGMWWSFEHDAHLGALDDPARYYTAILTANDTGEAIEEVLEKLRQVNHS